MMTMMTTAKHNGRPPNQRNHQHRTTLYRVAAASHDGPGKVTSDRRVFGEASRPVKATAVMAPTPTVLGTASVIESESA